MEHETEAAIDLQTIEYACRPEAQAETIAEMRALLDKMDGHLTVELMDGLRVQVERVIASEGKHASR